MKTKRRFLCWVPAYGQEQGDGEEVTDAWDAEHAAKRFLDHRLADFDYPRELRVAVFDEDAAVVTRWDIEVQSEPVFYAVQVEDSDTGLDP